MHQQIFLRLVTSLGLSTSAAFAAEPATELGEMLVTSDRTDQTLFEQLQPAGVLTGADLRYEIAPTLGETIAREPGVSATAFGPGASRPIIRGLGEDRVRVLQNGTTVFDVSNVSPDHAVASEPLTAKSIEILRGPASLLYGPNTVGGVVNVIDGRIPTEQFAADWPTGKFATSYSSADRSFANAGSVDWGAGPFAFHLDGFHRESENIRIPSYARSARLRAADPLPPGETEARGTLPNSATQSTGATFGGSYIGEKGYIGLAVSGIDSRYGTVAEEEVTIDLRQRRVDLQGAVFEPFRGAKEIDFKLGWTDYGHTEFEGPDPGTRFLTEGVNGRLELLHEPVLGFEGAIGAEAKVSDFSALGSEAFLPSVDSRAYSLFVFEERLLTDALRAQFSARFDNQTHETAARERDFHVFGASTGLVWEPVEHYAVTSSIAATRRPPTYVELFADGPHIATGVVEIGDPDLGTEDSLALDLGVKKNAGRVTGSAGVYYYRFSNFINLSPTGTIDPGEGLPVFAYRAVDAELAGAEVETVIHLLDAVDPAAPAPDQALGLILGADFVRAENRKTGEPLPFIPPVRGRSALDYRNGAFGAKLEGIIAAAQSRNAANELPTDGYFQLNAGVSYDFEMQGVKTTAWLKGINLSDEEIRYSTSALKDMAPLAGRGVALGLTAQF